MATGLTTIDYLVVAIYLVGTLALGLWIGRRVKTGKDFFLGGRQLPWWAIGMSLVATDIGGTDIIGVGGAAFAHGLAVANFEWIGCVPAMIVAAFVFIPYFWRIGVYTIPEFLERRFNASLRSALALCWLIFMACNLGIMLLASAKMMGAMVNVEAVSDWFGWEVERSLAIARIQWVCILATAAMVGVYTCAGGLAAVVYTDMIQCAVMIAGCLLVVALGLIEIGGISGLREGIAQHESDTLTESEVGDSVDAAQTRRGRERTSLILPVDTATPFPWTGIFFGLALILSPAYWIGNQAIVQRSLGAKSEFEAKAAYIWGALLKNIIPFIVAVPGLIALVMFPQLEDGDQAFPKLVSVLLPTGLRGVFLAAFIAALMSSIDSYLNSASTIVTNDFYRRFVNVQADEQRILLIGRGVTLLLVLWAIFFAGYLMGRSEGIYAIFQTMMAFFQGPALAVLMSGLLWRRATGTAALIGFIAGVLSSIGLFALTQPQVYTALGWKPLFQISEPFLYFSVWAFLVSLSLIVPISLCTKPDPASKQQYVVFATESQNGEPR